MLAYNSINASVRIVQSASLFCFVLFCSGSFVDLKVGPSFHFLKEKTCLEHIIDVCR